MLANCPSEAFIGPPLLRRGVVVDPVFKRHISENKRQVSGDIKLIECVPACKFDPLGGVIGIQF